MTDPAAAEPTSESRSVRKRRAILDAATEVFLTEGFAGLLPGCRDIAGLRNPGALAHGCAPVSRSGGLLGGAGSGCRLAAGRTAEALRRIIFRGRTARWRVEVGPA